MIETLLAEWLSRELPSPIRRDVAVDLSLISPKTKVRKVLVVTGFRRTGKTFEVMSVIQKLLSDGLTRKEVIYINFEDERIPMTTNTLSDLLPKCVEVFGALPKYLFLDEVQKIPGWSTWLRRIIDTTSIHIVVTGSSSKLSSSEIPTEIRGRAWVHHMGPLTFPEYRRFSQGSDTPELYEKTPIGKSQIIRQFRIYLEYGGLPEVVLVHNNQHKLELLQGYFQTLVQMDIAERHAIKRTLPFSELMKVALASPSFTYSSLERALNEAGIPLTKPTITSYLSYATSSYFLSVIDQYAISKRTRISAPRKLYALDTGFYKALLRVGQYEGRSLETVCARVLLARKNLSSIYYYKDRNGYEVDSIMFDNGHISEAWQVATDLSDYSTRQREYRSLVALSKRFPHVHLYLIGISEKPSDLPDSITYRYGWDVSTS